MPILMLLSHLQTLEIEFAETILRLVGLFALVFMVAFFVAAELSLVAASRYQIDQLARQIDGSAQAKAAQLVQHAQNNLEYYLAVTQTGTTAISLLLGWLGEGATVHWIEPWIQYLPLSRVPAMITAHSVAIALAFLLVTYVEILLGELVPKVLAASAPEKTALLLIHPLQFCSYLFMPLLLLLQNNVRLLTGRFTQVGAIPELPHDQLTQADLHSVLVSGRVEVDQINQDLGLALPTSAAYKSIAGFMIHHLGRLPITGERLQWGELELEAVRVANNCLEIVLLRHLLHPLLFPQSGPSLATTIA